MPHTPRTASAVCDCSDPAQKVAVILYPSLGTPLLSFNVYGEEGALGAAIVVATLTLVADAGFALVQRLVTPKGLKIARGDRATPRFLPTPSRRVQTP